MPLTGRGDPHRIEPGAFQQDVRRAFVHARALAADDPAEPDRPAPIGDDAIVGGRLIHLVVESEEPVTLPAAPDNDVAGQLGRIIDVERAGLVDRIEVGDVHERRNRPQAHRLETLLQPLGTRTVADPPNQPPPEDDAA